MDTKSILEFIAFRAGNSDANSIDHSEMCFTISDTLVTRDDESSRTLLDDTFTIYNFFKWSFTFNQNTFFFREFESWWACTSNALSIFVDIVDWALNLDTFTIYKVPSSWAITELALAINELISRRAFGYLAFSV